MQRVELLAAVGLVSACVGSSGGTGGSANTSTSTSAATSSTGSTGTHESTGSGSSGPVPDLCPGIWCTGEGWPNYGCDVYLQDCPPGEACKPWANDGGWIWNGWRCTPHGDPPGHLGDPCVVEGTPVSGVDSCGPGLMCWGVDTRTGEGTCAALCGGSDNAPTCGDPETICAPWYEGDLPLCLTPCDPTASDCVGPTPLCAAADAEAEFVCIQPYLAGSSPRGGPCEFPSTCEPGLLCLEAERVPGCVGSIGCCALVCDLDDPAGDAQCDGAPSPESCVPWSGTAPASAAHVGVCIGQ